MLEKIRELYRPIQPAVSQVESKVYYIEYLPQNGLRDYIYCYWELHTTTPLEQDFVYRVVSDGCIDIFFDLKDTSESFVMGFCRQFTEFDLSQDFHYVGIRFLPTMFPQLFRIDASTLSDSFFPLASILNSCAVYIRTEISRLLPIEQVCESLDQYFLEVLRHSDFDDDSRLYDAIESILTHQGVVNVQTDLSTGMSPRQMRRVFHYYIGTSPKVFTKVVRFQNILRAKPSSQSLKRNKLFYDLGYYDQAHFIKDFKSLYGVTPSKAFGRE